MLSPMASSPSPSFASARFDFAQNQLIFEAPGFVGAAAPVRLGGANPGCLYHRPIRFYVASPVNSIFMLGGAPETHEVLSKTPRMDIPTPPNGLPRGVSDQG
jgi:hypothetical protein